MGKVKIPYYVVAKGRGYWRPHPRMRRSAFRSFGVAQTVQRLGRLQTIGTGVGKLFARGMPLRS